MSENSQFSLFTAQGRRVTHCVDASQLHHDDIEPVRVKLKVDFDVTVVLIPEVRREATSI